MDRIREIVGLGFLSIGLIGFALPVLPGVPFLVAALAVLGPGHPKLRPWLKRVERWVPFGKKRGVPDT
jgi:uncharacterized membrane protein YbaN (DUF454 family)